MKSRRRTARLPAAAPWATVCWSIDMREQDGVAVRAERARGRVTWRPATREEVVAAAAEPSAVIAACLPAVLGLARRLAAPFASRRKAARVFPTLLDIELPFPVEECVYHFLDLELMPEGKTGALAVAARSGSIDRVLDPCREAGFDPMLLDHEALALWTQSLAEAPVPDGADGEARVVVSLSDEGTVVVAGEGARFLGVHTLRGVSEEGIARAVKARFGPDPRPVHWHWCGPGADEGSRVADLHNLLRRAWPGPSVIHEQPRFFLARAIATRALLPGPLRCNFRSGRHVHSRVARWTRGRANRAAAALFAAGILLMASSFAATRQVARTERRLDRAFETVRDSILGYRLGAKGALAVQKARAATEERAAALQPFMSFFASPLSARVVTLVQMGQRDGLTYETVSLTPAQVTLSGTADRWNGWKGVETFLRSLGLEVSVKPGNAPLEGRTPFTLTAGAQQDE